MAFWHILQGKTSHQTWLHALDFDALVPKYKQWLHGNPYKDGRKVVLDEDVLKSLEKSKLGKEERSRRRANNKIRKTIVL